MRLMSSIKLQCKATITCVNTWEFFTPTKLEEGGGQPMDTNIGLRDGLTTMQGMPSLFKSLTNLNLIKFEELAQLVVLNIIGHVRPIREPHRIFGQPSNLTPKQHLFNFILYMKHNKITKYDASLWNQNKSAINDDGIFIASCINSAITNEIRWPTIEECRVLATQLPQL